MKYTFLLLMTFLFCLFSCKEVKVGYLDAQNAEYIPNQMIIKAQNELIYEMPWDPDYARVNNDAPWVTLKIEKVQGTNPILYEIINVTSPDGGDIETFKKAIKIRGVGIMEFPLKHNVKPAKYVVSIKIRNESYEQDIFDAYTFIVH